MYGCDSKTMSQVVPVQTLLGLEYLGLNVFEILFLVGNWFNILAMTSIPQDRH